MISSYTKYQQKSIVPGNYRMSPGAVDKTRIKSQGSRFLPLAALVFLHSSAGSGVLSGHKMKH